MRRRVDVAVLDEMVSQRGRVDPGAGFELPRRLRRRCHTDDCEPRVLDEPVIEDADAGIDAADELLDQSLLECEQ